MYYKKTLLVTSFLIILSFLFIFNTPNTNAMTVTEIQALVQQLQQQITQLQKQLDVIEEGSTAWCHNFNIKLRYGDTGNEVNLLQLALDKEGLFVSQTDKGGYFGNHTAAAVVSFQEKYANDILAHWGLKNGTGYVGSTTLDKLNKIYGCREKNEGETLTTPQLTSPVNDSGKSLWDWDYCSSDYLCNTGEGDCDSDSDCSTGYCASNVGRKYGQTSSMDICEGEETESITVISPNGGEEWKFGETYNITWDSTGVEDAYLYLWFENGVTCKLADVSAGDGTYSVKIEENMQCSDLPSTVSAGQYKILIYSEAGMALKDLSDDYFTLIETEDQASSLWSLDYCSPDRLCNAGEGDCDSDSDCSTGYCASNVGRKYGQTSSMDVCEKKETEFITVTSPNGGEEFQQGSNIIITWDSMGTDYIDIDLQDFGRKQEDESTPFVLDLVNNYSASKGTYTWNVYSDWPTGNIYKIRVESSDGLIQDASNNYFSIVSATQTCTDSDGGKDYNVKGTAKGLFGGIDTESLITNPSYSELIDVCDTTNDTYLKEYYCDSNKYIRYTHYKCPYGCYEGVCLSALTLSAPTLKSPYNRKSEISLTPTLSWYASDGTEWYHLYFKKSTETSWQVKSDINNTSYTFSSSEALSSNTTYQWKVRSCKTGLECKDSNTWSFTTANEILSAPTLKSPYNRKSGVSLRPILNWYDVDNVEWYHLYYKKSTDVSWKYRSNLTTSYYIFSNSESALEPNTTYQWQVKSCREGPECKDSTTWSFTTTQTLGSGNIENQLADISETISYIAEKMKEALNR